MAYVSRSLSHLFHRHFSSVIITLRYIDFTISVYMGYTVSRLRRRD